MISLLGGWPVVEKNWKEDSFVVEESLGLVRANFTSIIIIFCSVAADDKNSSSNIIQVVFLFLDFLQRAVMVCFFFYTKMTRNLIKAKWNVLNVHINHGRVTAFLNERRRIVKMFRLNYFNSKCNLCLCVSRSDVSTTALGVKNTLLHNKVFRWSLLSYTCWTMESGRFFILSFFRFDNSVTPH